MLVTLLREFPVWSLLYLIVCTIFATYNYKKLYFESISKTPLVATQPSVLILIGCWLISFVLAPLYLVLAPLELIIKCIFHPKT
jgi:hypothetical protein